MLNRIPKPDRTPLRAYIDKPDVLVGRLFDRISANPIRWAIGLFLTAYVGGGFVFSLIEHNASFFDGLWWAYISMMTVGYGDYSPHTWVVRTLAYFVVFFGWSSLLIAGGTLAGRITQRRLSAAYAATPEISDDLLAVVAKLHEGIEDLERLLPLVSDPRVVEALRVVHAERGS